MTTSPVRPAMQPNLLQLLGIAAVYFLAGKLGLMFAQLNSSATAVWPPTGIALAAALYYGYGVWPAVFVSAFFVNLTTTGDVMSSLGIAMGNSLECVTGAYLVNRYANGLDAFRRARTIFGYAFGAAFVSTTLAATIGVASLAAFGFLDGAAPMYLWLTWWLGDATSAMVFAPMILMWTGASRVSAVEGRGRERFIVFAGAVVSCALVFFTPGLRDYPLGFLCLPALAWAVLRLGQRDMITTIAIVMGMAMLALELGVGPYVLRTRADSLLVLHAFVLTGALLSLPVSAVIADRERMLGEAHEARVTAEDAAKTKDEFLALLSHELRNPLAAITAATGLLRQTSGSDPMAGRAVDIVERQTAHLGRLVDDLLDISRITRGKIALEKKALSISDITGRAVESARPLFAARGQRFQFEEPDEPIWIEGDPTRLTQVIVNLLTNAAKYTPNSGQIRLIVTREDGNAVIRVRDTGIGIAPDLLPSIFDLFTQGDQSLERSEGGLGLGLAVAKRLVELSSGTIEVHSDGPWRGSEFTVRLPLVEAPAATEKRTSGGARLPRSIPAPVCKVLVVDDNVDSAEMLAVLLRLKGNDVRIAYDGPSAVTMAVEYQPAVSLIDIGLPGMSGYEVAKELRRRCGSAMGLIAVTGYGQDEDRRRSREAGFDEHLTKPVAFDVLEKHVAALSEGRAV